MRREIEELFIEKDLNQISIFVFQDGEIIKEKHNLRPFSAFKIAMEYLYKGNEKVAGVCVIIRNKHKILFSAINPSEENTEVELGDQ